MIVRNTACKLYFGLTTDLGSVISGTTVTSNVRPPGKARLEVTWEGLARAGQAEPREKSIPGRENGTCKVVRGHGLGMSKGMKEGWCGRSGESKGGALTTQMTIAATHRRILAQKSECGGFSKPPLTSVL